jgi:hypothetical protein
MRVIETKVYTFEELSQEAKEKAIENNRHINVEYLEWYHDVYDTFKEKYSSLFEITNMYFSGFWTQGDGAMFEYDGINDKLIDEFIEQLQLTPLGKKQVKELVYFSGYGKQSGLNYHERSCNHKLYVELNGYSSYKYSNIHKFLIELQLDFEAFIEERYIELAKELFQSLYDEYEWHTSDESIRERLIEGEYEFTESGELI